MANKEAAVAELTEKFQSSTAVLLTEYRGLTVAKLKELRKSISEDATYAVVKNTLTKIAANNAGISSFDDELVGPSAIAFVHGRLQGLAVRSRISVHRTAVEGRSHGRGAAREAGVRSVGISLRTR